MNKELKDLQFLGFIGIYKESFKLIFTWHKIFTYITLALIFPFSCIILAYAAFSTFISTKITHNLSTLDTSQVGSTTYHNVSNKIYKEWSLYWLANIIYFVFSIIFLLFSVSAVVYTVACIYTNKEITFKKVLSVVPKVWKRIMVTFLCMLFVIFVSTFVFVLVILIVGAIMFSVIAHNKPSNNNWLVWFGVVAFVTAVYLLVMVYMSFVWQLAYVISVLEKCSGFKAMAKSRALIKGKMVTSLVLYLVLGVLSIPTHFLVKQIRENYSYGSSYKVGECIWYGILSLVWITLLSLFNLLVQTVLYFVCKSYHHQDIDKSSLADHLEVYYGEYVPLTSKSIQLQGFNV